MEAEDEHGTMYLFVPWFYSTESEYDAEDAEPISEERAMEIRSKYVYEHPVFIPFAEDN